MRILHTSDLHLSKEKEHTLDALKCLIETCKTESVDLLTIGGDMFHKPHDVEQMRTDLRKIFSGLDFDVISISGNHDEIAYTRNLDFGDLKMVTKSPFEIISYEEVNIIALPYTETLTDEKYTQLRVAVDKDRFNALLIHCTLDIGYTSSDFGEEEERKYCPVSTPMLASLGYDVVLGGHFHKDYYVKELGEGSRFIYPGSPVSLSKEERGQRQAALVDTESNEITRIPLDTHFYDEKRVFIFPGNEEASLKSIEEWKQEFDGMNCTLSVEVDGFGEMDEVMFRDRLSAICDGWEIVNEYKDVGNVLDHSLFKRFVEKINAIDGLDTGFVKKTVIEVFSEMLAGGKIE